jgi:two-component system chemotaxis response regulator CheB
MNTAPLAQRRIAAIVIGASAGGIEALVRLLPALPQALPAPVFIVQHLPRERPSLLVDIFAPKCALAVREALDKDPIEPGTIYFAPPDYHLLIDRGPQLSLSADELVNFSRPAIDVLFESAADVYGRQLLGIVLTGGNDDGAAGLAAIHVAGGLTVIQQPDTAQVSIMPAAALKRVAADFVLPLDQITGLLKTLEYGHVV